MRLICSFEVDCMSIIAGFHFKIAKEGRKEVPSLGEDYERNFSQSDKIFDEKK